MEELINVFSSNYILILGIVLFIFGLILLSYLLTTIIFKKRQQNEDYVREEKLSSEKANNELENVLDKIQKTLDKKEELDNVDVFEKEQEENAIISYQELVKAAKKDFPQMNLENEVVIKPVIVEETVTEGNEDYQKFKSSIFVSPLGVANKNATYCNEVKVKKDYLKDIADSRFSSIEYKVDNVEPDKDNEKFLDDLKSFRNNL